MRNSMFVLLASACLLWAGALPLHAALAVKVVPVGKAEQKVDPDNNLPYWELQEKGDSSRLKVIVRVSPTKQTYMTIRFKGGGGAPGFPYLCDENGNGYPPYDAFDEGGLWGRRPGSFYYQTIAIPLKLTKGKKQITTYIGASGIPVQRIYRIYTHTNPLFQPREDDAPGKVIKPYEFPRFKPLSKSVVAEVRKKLLELMSNQCDRNAREQLWAPNWRELVAKGEWPADLVGGFRVEFIMGPDGKPDVPAMKNRITWRYDRTNNFGPLLNVAVMAIAYATPGTRQYKDKVMLERIALALDFMRRAQAINGAYYSVWKKGIWVGGPDRLWASGTPLEGAGHRGFGHAFILCGKDMEKAGLLDQKIDDDCNPDTPPIPRRQAYLDLFSASAGYLMGRGGHAPNQEMYQLDGLFMQVKALKMLNAPKDRIPDPQKLEERAKVACGAVPVGAWTWVSPKGISLEHGGYTCEYGRDQVTMYYRLFQHAGYKFAKERARIAGYGFSHFVFPVYTENKTHGYAICAFLNTRHRNRVGGDGFPPCYYQALVFRNPIHIRLFQLIYMDMKPGDAQGWGHPMGGNWFYTESYEFMRNTREQLELIKELCDPESPLCADVHLPTEHGQPNFVWSDEVAQVVSFKDGDKRVMMSFNQWHSGHSFIEFQSPEYDQFLRIPHDATRDDKGNVVFNAFHSLVLGDWYIAMNANFKDAVKVQVPASFAKNANELVNLATGKEVKRTFMLPAQTTIVIKRK